MLGQMVIKTGKKMGEKLDANLYPKHLALFKEKQKHVPRGQALLQEWLEVMLQGNTKNQDC